MAKSITSKSNSSDTNKQQSTAKKAIASRSDDAKQNKIMAKKTTANTNPKTKSQPMASESARKVTKVDAKSSEVKSSSKIKEPTKAVLSKDNNSPATVQPVIKKKKFPAAVVFGKPSVKKVEEKSKTEKANSAPVKTKDTTKIISKAAIKIDETKTVTTSKTPQAKSAVKPKVEVPKASNAKKTVIATKPSVAKDNAKAQPKIVSKVAVAPVKAQATTKPKVKTEPSKPVAPVKKIASSSKTAVSKSNPANASKTAVNKTGIRYSDEDLAIFRQIIEQQKGEIIEEINSLNERIEAFNNRDFTEESTYSLHMAEQTSDAIEAERARNRISDLTDLLKKLNDAMLRIENKTYGICRICNCLIAKERLLVVPVTTLSASYKLHGKCPEDGIDRTEKIK